MLLMAPLQTAPSVPVEFVITLLALYGATLTAYIGTAAFFGWRLGRVPTRQEHNELRAEIKSDMVEFRREYKADMAEFRREHRADMDQLRQEHKADMDQLRQELLSEFRRSHQQLMLALVNHSHREDGQAVFATPPEMETTPTPADN